MKGTRKESMAGKAYNKSSEHKSAQAKGMKKTMGAKTKARSSESKGAKQMWQIKDGQALMKDVNKLISKHAKPVKK